jgi:hypothetical protein
MPLSVYQERAMLELLFVIGFFVVLLATGVSLLVFWRHCWWQPQ